MTEFELIETCFTDWSVTDTRVLQGIGDDCLVWLDPEPLVISTDTAVIGRHFPAHASAAQTAARAFLPAISDLAAMGATPAFFTLALALPKHLNNGWVIEFAAALRKHAEHFNIFLAGGDTTAAEQLTVTISVHGTCAHPILRSGARAGDDIWVSGELGNAAAALPFILEKREHESPPEWLAAYWHPTPQIALGQALLGCIHSAIDISDGLIGDAAHIARRSQVDLSIDIDRLPIHEKLKVGGHAALKLVLAGGDDYQLCFTADPITRDEILAVGQQVGVALTRIGTVTEGKGLVRWYDHGSEIQFDWQSFRHF